MPPLRTVTPTHARRIAQAVVADLGLTDLVVQADIDDAITDHVALADPHTLYQKESEKATANGYASLDGTGKVPAAQLPAGGGSTATTIAQGIVKVDHNSAGDPVALTVAGHGTDADPHPLYQRESEKGAASGYASLDGAGKIPSSQLPAIAISQPFVVGSQVAMLALVAERGDIAIRTDQNRSYILSTDDPTILADWLELVSPTDTVLSVNGETGAVSLVAADIPYAGGPGLSATNVETAIDELATEKVDTTRTISTTAPLAGGGDLSANRTLTVADATNVVKGVVELADDGESAASLVVQSNDNRMALAATSVQPVRSISTTAPLTGGGDLSANRTLAVSDATGGANGVIRLTGALGGVAALPAVLSVRTTSGPTDLVLGAIVDGEYLRRVGATVVSGAPSGGSSDIKKVLTADQAAIGTTATVIASFTAALAATTKYRFRAIIHYTQVAAATVHSARSTYSGTLLGTSVSKTQGTTGVPLVWAATVKTNILAVNAAIPVTTAGFGATGAAATLAQVVIEGTIETNTAGNFNIEIVSSAALGFIPKRGSTLKLEIFP